MVHPLVKEMVIIIVLTRVVKIEYSWEQIEREKPLQPLILKYVSL